MANLHRIQVVDSHTGGEPTRVVISGGPDLGTGPLSERVQRLSRQFDRFRSAVVNEPRGSDVLVGAFLVSPHAPDCDFGVIFFNNVGALGMCGHGTIGLMVTLAHLGRVRPGTHRIDTPVGPVSATLHEDGSVSVANVPSYRHKSSVVVQVPGIGAVSGDVAWGQLVLPGSLPGVGVVPAKRGDLDRCELAYSPGGQRSGLSRGGPRGTLWASRIRRALAQLCAVPGQGLRPIPLRDGHQRQTGLLGRGWKTGRGSGLDPGRDSGQRLPGSTAGRSVPRGVCCRWSPEPPMSLLKRR